MKLIRDIAAEIYSMFFGDWPLSLGVLAVVGSAWAALRFSQIGPQVIAFGLLIGCIVVLLTRVFAEARRLRPK